MATSTNTNRKGKGGPKTPEGKARSSMNALRHGACASALVLAAESKPEFDRIERAYYDHFQPVTFLECELLDEMIAAKWRQRRCWNVETTSIDLEVERSLDEFLRNEGLGGDGSRETALAVRKLCNESTELGSLNRYETRYHRMYHRALAKLLELQERRLRQGQPSPEPLPVKTEPEPDTEAATGNLRNELPEATLATPRVMPIRSFSPQPRPSWSNFARPLARAASA